MPNPNDRIVLTAIVPKGKVAQVNVGKIAQQLQNVLNAARTRLTRYPSQRQPTAYVRTGEYGRRWTTTPPAVIGNDMEGTLGTNLEYAGYVGGLHGPQVSGKPPRQTRVNEAVGWESIEDVAPDEWDAREPEIQRLIQGGK